MSAFTIFGVCALFLSYADVTEAAVACTASTCHPDQFVNMYQLQVPATCVVPIVKDSLFAYAKAASGITTQCDGTAAGTNLFTVAQPLTSTNVAALARFALGAVYEPVVGNLDPVLDDLYTENYGSFDALNADDVNAMTALITALLEQLRPSYATFTAITTAGLLSPIGTEMTGLTTLMKAGLTTVKGCAFVSRQDVNIWYAIPTVHPAGVAGVFWRTCETTQQTNNGVVEHHLDFSNMGIDVVHGLCHIVASFIEDGEASTVKSTLHVNFDHNFIGQHGFLSGLAAFTSSPPSGQAGYIKRANAAVQFCGQIKSWLPSYIKYPNAPTKKLDRVFISCRDCKFDEFSSRENLIFPGTILPAVPGTLASGATADEKPRMLEASTLGGFDATDNDRMLTMTLASKDQAIAASDKNGKGGFKMADKAKVQLMLDAKRNIGEFPDVAKRLGLTDNSHGTAGVYGDADILSTYTTEYWVAMLGILIASIIGELGALRVCKM